MPCTSPLFGFRAPHPNGSGKRGLVFRLAAGVDVADAIAVPCGRCISCMIERTRQWASRCVHESNLHDQNCFITLTYGPEHLPPGGTLVRRDFQLFMKRLRRRVKKKVSFFACGEYGDLNERPHYHALLFGYDFPDKTWWKNSVSGDPIFRSALLDDLWQRGHASVAALTYETAAYTARYVMKKITGPDAKKHYERIDAETGEVFARVPEFCLMSLRPAIGKGWFERFSGELWPADSVIMQGKEVSVPRYYDKLLERKDAEALAEVKSARQERAKAFEAEQHSSRRAVRAVVVEARSKLKRRSL